LFDKIDVSKSGLLNSQDIKTVLKNLDAPHSDEVV
jgi:solute carrier family 25 phosphate transporter 23/24/25/41